MVIFGRRPKITQKSSTVIYSAIFWGGFWPKLALQSASALKCLLQLYGRFSEKSHLLHNDHLHCAADAIFRKNVHITAIRARAHRPKTAPKLGISGRNFDNFEIFRNLSKISIISKSRNFEKFR